MDKVFFFSIFLVFAGALMGSVMQHRRVDRVLKDLRGFHVTACSQGKHVWGKFRLYSNAIELVFSRPYTNRRGNLLTSYIVFSEHMSDVEAIYRYHNELTPANQQRRLTEIEHIKHPGMARRSYRTIRNFMVAFREAIDESIGMLMNRVQKGASTSVLKGQDDYLNRLKTNALGAVSTAAYDPVLEHYISHRVVFEAGKEDGEQIEFAGVLKEYSAAWVSILDCYISTENQLPLSDAARLMVQRKMDFQLDIDHDSAKEGTLSYRLKITNHDPQDITIVRIEGGEGYQHLINKSIAEGEALNITLSDIPTSSLSDIEQADLPISLTLVAPERQIEQDSTPQDAQEEAQFPALPHLTLIFDTLSGVDVYIPRCKGLLRHGGVGGC